MSEIRNDAPPGAEPNRDDSTPAPVEPQDLPALNGQAGPTDDTPTIISRAGPHGKHDDPVGGLRGRKLAHFELIEPVGVGGMAAVLRARDTELDRIVALKILPPDMADDPENVRRFHQEARSAARLDHENVARVFYCGEDQRLHFIAFEFVEGDNLRTILERRGRLPVAEALHYVLQIAAGLAHAAHRGVVHRDIKPSNIIITPTGRAKLVDMGLARNQERQDGDALTQSGVTLGTFDYISPEQALEPREADVRSDIYSLGCTFYHLLTGHPPVPDGTAAKKLHHHQHVKPRDPRELVPGLPDEVVVILDRMMAKRPQDRYQSPEQLVHHLLLAARKFGSSGDVPEGVLSVEAALPPPPGNRPLLRAGLAAGLVVLLIVTLEAFHRPAASPSSPTRPAEVKGPESVQSDSAPAVAPTPTSPKEDNPAPPKPADQPPQPPPPVRVMRYDDADGKDLGEWVKAADKDAEKEIYLGNDHDLALPPDPRDGDVGLPVTGPRVTIQAKPGRRPTIRFTHDSRPQGPDGWAAVSIDSPDVTVRGVRVVVDGQNADVAIAGLRLHGPADRPSTFLVDNCELIQVRPGAGRKRLASVEAAADDAAEATLNLTGCRFLSFTGAEGDVLTNGPFGGDDAVRRDGPVGVQATDCAFGPHGAAFRLERGQEASPAPPLTLHHCSVLAAGPSTVFDVRPGAAVDVSVYASLFSHLAAPGPADGAAVVLRQADPNDKVAFAEHDSRYHGFAAYWLIGDDVSAATWSDFQNRVAGALRSSSLVTDSPWKLPDPAEPFLKYNFKEDRADDHFASAFQIKESRPDLRLAADKAAPVGVEALGSVNYVEALKEADKAAERAALKRRIVEPGVNDSAHRVYSKLDEALSASESGDEILLQWDGPQPVEPMRLKTSLDVTIRPYEGRRPQLRLAASPNGEAEPAMFRVFDGKLKLDSLDIVLRPDADFRRQSVVDVAGQGQCTFTNCVVTMDQNGQADTRLTALWLSDPARAMMPMRTADQPPQITLDGCFIRGDGDLAACQLSRPFGLDATNTLAVLKGAFLSVEAGPAAAPPAGQMALNLKRVTAYLTGNLIRLRVGKDSANLLPVRCVPTDCLFVAAARDPQALIHLDDSEMEEKALGRAVLWDPAGRVEYGNFGVMLDQTPPGEEMAPTSIGLTRWETSWDKTGQQVNPFHFGPGAPPPSADASFSTALPTQFRPSAPADSSGADVDKVGPAAPK